MEGDEPYYICHENYYDHLMSILQRLDSLMDCCILLNNNEILSTHSFMIAALSGRIQQMPLKHPNTSNNLILLDQDAWSMKCLLEYFYNCSLAIPRPNVESLNKILHTLDLHLGADYFESEGVAHFMLNQSLKLEIIHKMWSHKHINHDVRIITAGMQETFAHKSILSACSDKLFTLFSQQSAQHKPAIVILLDFDLEDVETVLKFCYKGEVQIMRSQASKVSLLAKTLGIKNLFNTLLSLGYSGMGAAERLLEDNTYTTKITCEHSDITKRMFKTLFQEESLSDIQLICGDHTFKVHSAILNLSPFFRAIFKLTGWRNALVFLPQLSLDLVQGFVDYMYYGEVMFAGGFSEFSSAMEGLIDFNALPIKHIVRVPPEKEWRSDIEDTSTVLPKQETEADACSGFFTHGEAEKDVPKTDVAEVPKVKDSSVSVEQFSGGQCKPLTYKCDTCSDVFYSRRSLKLHLTSHPDYKLTKCAYCEKMFEVASLRKRHERLHTEENHPMHACDVCGKTYKNSHSLYKHACIQKGRPTFECAICGTVCSRKEYLEEHVRTHTGTKPYKCDFCGKCFVGKTGLNHHKKIHKPPQKDAVCEVCGKSFTRKAFWTHMKTHDKQYECDLCHKFFSTPATLKSHTAITHTEARLFACNLCHKKFALKNHLVRHKTHVHKTGMHLSEPNCTEDVSNNLSGDNADRKTAHSCKWCGRQFSRHSSLVYHERIHSGVQPHTCHMCTKSFTRPDALQKHIRSHTKERPYICHLCQLRYSSKSALNKHLERHAKKKTPNDNFLLGICQTTDTLSMNQDMIQKNVGCQETDAQYASLDPEPPQSDSHQQYMTSHFTLQHTEY